MRNFRLLAKRVITVISIAAMVGLLVTVFGLLGTMVGSWSNDIFERLGRPGLASPFDLILGTSISFLAIASAISVLIDLIDWFRSKEL